VSYLYSAPDLLATPWQQYYCFTTLRQRVPPPPCFSWRHTHNPALAKSNRLMHMLGKEMMLRNYIILSLLAALTGCSSFSSTTDVPKPKQTDETTITRTGFLPSDIHQHPLIVGTVISEGHQGYLDLFEDGKKTKQVIVVYPTHMKRPEEMNRLIEIKGKLHSFRLGKPSQGLHKRTYENEAIEIHEWKYRD
jgi:hypothetical protein